MLSDPRARRVIENVAERCNWSARGPREAGEGSGLGWARYKNHAAYAAVAVEVEVDQEVRLRRVWCAADAGLVINPDGARNQLEGGIVQAASMTLKEQVRMEGDGVTSLDWDGYPILRFSEVPEIEHGDHPRARPADTGHGGVHVRSHRRRDRQCGRACAGHAHQGHAVDPRADRGGAAEVTE